MVNWVKRDSSGAGTAPYLPRGGERGAAPAKRGPGRPRADAGSGDLLHVTLCLTDAQVAFATRKGGGNISLGVRRIVDEQIAADSV